MAATKPRGTLHGKILTRTLTAALVPMLGLACVTALVLLPRAAEVEAYIESERATRTHELAGQRLRLQAEAMANEIDAFMRERIADAQGWAKTPVVVEAAKIGATAHQEQGLVGMTIPAIEDRFLTVKSLGLAPQADAYLRAQTKASRHFGEVFFTDFHGYNVAMTNPTSDFVQSDESWWQRSWGKGLALGEVMFDDSAGIWSIDISVRIDDLEQGRALGVMKTVLDLAPVQESADAYARGNPDVQVTVATGDGRLIAETASEHARSRIMNETTNLRSQGSEALQAAFQGARAGVASDARSVLGYARSGARAAYADLTPGFSGLDWVIVFEQNLPEADGSPAESALARMRRALAWILGAGTLVAGIAGLGLATVCARRTSAPVRALCVQAERVSVGESSERVETEGGEELVRLAEAFERMRRSVTVANERLRRMHRI